MPTVGPSFVTSWRFLHTLVKLFTYFHYTIKKTIILLDSHIFFTRNITLISIDTKEKMPIGCIISSTENKYQEKRVNSHVGGQANITLFIIISVTFHSELCNAINIH